jgi:hypothetical protein
VKGPREKGAISSQLAVKTIQGRDGSAGLTRRGAIRPPWKVIIRRSTM